MNQSLRQFFTFLLVALSLPASAPAARGDAVTDWNAIMEATVVPTDPFLQTKNAATIQLAVFEAVNSIIGTYEPYHRHIEAANDASPEAAAIAAAHHALVALYPEARDQLDAHRAASLCALSDDAAKAAGIDVGVRAAQTLLALHRENGASLPASDAPLGRPGTWQPTPPAFHDAIWPGWGRLKPFALESGAQFRPGPPPAPDSAAFRVACREVHSVGGVTSAARPSNRSDVARFYAVVLGIDCYNPAARQASAAQHRTLEENARIFALLAVALSDGLVCAMEAKYHYDYWRPVTAILAGYGDVPPDPDFLPFVSTPPFPSYPSAHAVVGGAARTILTRAFGADGHDITLRSDKIPEVVLHYTAWKQITDDIDDARIFGGIHYRFDQTVGAEQGRQVGEHVWQHLLQPIASGSARS